MKKSSSSSRCGDQRMSRSAWQRVTTVGIDVGDRISRWCALDDDGEIVGEGKIATRRAAFMLMFDGIEQKRFAIETGMHSRWINHLLETVGHEVLVANSLKLQLISKSRQKDDRHDAMNVARLARFDPELLHPIQHRSQIAQQHLELLRARDVLVAVRTRLVNHLRGAAKPFGIRLPKCSPSALVKKAPPAVPAELTDAMTPMLQMIKSLSAQIRDYDRHIERLAGQVYVHSKALRRVSGVGALTAMAFMLTIDNPHRFRRSRSVGAWLGLTPSRRDSGDSQPQMRITKEGDRYVRRLLVGSAQYLLGPFGVDCDLRRHGLAIAARGGKNAKRRAVVAVARKLAVLLHRLWITQAEYRPLQNSSTTHAA